MRASGFAGRTLAIAIVLTTLASCGGDDSVQPPATPPPLFPLAVGNRWSYIESLVTSTGTWVKVDTVLVVGVRTHDGATWYEIHGRFNPTIAASEFTARNDSVFSLQHTEAPGGLAPVVSLEYIPPPGADSLSYSSVFGGDVLLVKSVTDLGGMYAVPAGNFTDCAAFDYRIWPERFREVLKPGLGVLSWEVRADSSVYGPAWRATRSLVGYHVAAE